jgi:hypothetical protein
MTEQEIAQYESDRNKSMTDWFNARPKMQRTDLAEIYFEAGFRMGWQARAELDSSKMEQATISSN